MPGDGQPVRDAAFSPDGQRVAVASSRSVRILDGTLRLVRTIDEGAVLVRFGPNGRRLIVAVADATSLRWPTVDQDKDWFDLSQRYSGPGAFSRTVRVRNVETGEQVSVLQANGPPRS